MTETTSRVYDLFYPSPPTLKNISAIAVVAELWRKEIARTEIKTADVRLFDLLKDIPLKKIIPDVPSTIYDLLDEFIAKFRSSMLSNSRWTQYVNYFDAFVWDWNGAIHDVRTAKRMMLCDGLTADEKFEIACRYCLEDDIRRIWPFASSKINLDGMDFDSCPLLYYWICYLTNELDNLPNPHHETIDEMMFYKCEHADESYSSLEYFWNRIPYERGSLATFKLSTCDYGLFARFTLTGLDDFQLETFIAEGGVDFMVSLLNGSKREKTHVLSAWLYIRNKMNESQFIRLIKKLLKKETLLAYRERLLKSLTLKERLHSRDEVYLYCEIWKNSPEDLKRWAINDVLLNERLFEKMSPSPWPSSPREMRFLITVLLDASFEQRHEFWHKNWRNLITGARVEDILRIMKLCFRNENDISLFMEIHMSKWENIRPCCVQLLKYRCFNELSEFLSFCYSDPQKVTELKQQLSRSNYLGEYSILGFDIIDDCTEELFAFVEDAFQNFDLRVEFKNQFLVSSATEFHFFECFRLGWFDNLIQFVEAFVRDEERAVVVWKQCLLDNFKKHLVSGVMEKLKADELQKFLVWLLNSEDEIGEFKQSLSVGDIFCNIIQGELENWNRRHSSRAILSTDRLDDFLNWYYKNDAEEIRKIKQRYSDKLKVFSDPKYKS
ncbi:uncharacterized protein LOC135839360 [Planococcus citri]|uniref:uncharacterized protein LOC135839360 n=1 Tax=Planococcus citri TaxID=170843 RepID=UPI0031F8763C